MLQIRSTETIESKKVPGVTFVVRRLNRIQRADRDLRIMDAALRYAELMAQFKTLKAVKEPSPEELAEMLRLATEIRGITERDFTPASIRAGLQSISGLEIDGKAATVESLLSGGTDAADELIREIFDACEAASALTGEQQKNSQSPSTSPEPGDGEISGSTAGTASA